MSISEALCEFYRVVTSTSVTDTLCVSRFVKDICKIVAIVIILESYNIPDNLKKLTLDCNLWNYNKYQLNDKNICFWYN